MNSELKNTIATELQRMDPNLSLDDESYKAAAVLMASLMIGPRMRQIAKELGYPLSLVWKFGYNLQRSGVWKIKGKGGMKVCGDYDHPERGGLAFWCDVGVATGMFKRA